MIIEEMNKWGCDCDEALERVSGDKDFLIECFFLFVKDTNIDKMKEGLKARDARKVFLASHALKGVAANLCLNPLLEPIKRIVEKTRNAKLDGVSEDLELFEERIAILKRILKDNA